MKELITSVLDTYINNNDISGASVLVIKDGSPFLRVDRGLADIKAGIPYSPETIIRLFSMTKPVTSAAIMLLIERGLIDRLDPVSDYIPSFKDQRYYDAEGNKHPVTRPVTIGDLLDMTSGLSYPDRTSLAGVDAYMVFEEIDRRLGSADEMTTLEVAGALGNCTLAFDPGCGYLYGTSADVLGAVMEIVTGMKCSEFLKKELFDPLEMEDTGFYVPKDKQPRLARSYVPASHLPDLPPNERPITDDPVPEYLGNNLGIKSRMDSPNAFESCGAGLASTLMDYGKFAGMLLNKGLASNGRRILSSETVDFMVKRTSPERIKADFHKAFDLSGFSYGNLLRIGTLPEVCDTLMVSGEYGWDGWLGPYFANIPKKNATILIALQRTNSGTYSLTRRLRNIIFSGL